MELQSGVKIAAREGCQNMSISYTGSQGAYKLPNTETKSTSLFFQAHVWDHFIKNL